MSYRNIQSILKNTSKELILNTLSSYKPLQSGNKKSLMYYNGGRSGKAHMPTWTKIGKIPEFIDDIKSVYDRLISKGFVLVESYTYNTIRGRGRQDADDVADPEEFPYILGLWRDEENDTEFVLHKTTTNEIGTSIHDIR